MPWVILLILAVLAILILAGPPLEWIIERIWPPDGMRAPGTRIARTNGGDHDAGMARGGTGSGRVHGDGTGLHACSSAWAR